jgi:hypothetical protein
MLQPSSFNTSMAGTDTTAEWYTPSVNVSSADNIEITIPTLTDTSLGIHALTLINLALLCNSGNVFLNVPYMLPPGVHVKAPVSAFEA